MSKITKIIMTAKRRTSPLWHHFEEIVPGKKAKCDYCSRKLAITSNSIGSLKRHMETKHPKIQINSKKYKYVRVDKFVDTGSGARASSRVKLEDRMETKKRHKMKTTPNNLIDQQAEPGPSTSGVGSQNSLLAENSRVEQINELLVKMIAKGYHDYRIVEQVEFRKFIESLNPAYTLPTRKTLKENLLPEVYNKVLEDVRLQIAGALSICITTDIWTSVTNDSYVSVTVHFIDTEIHQRCSVMIGCFEFNDTHTSVHIKNFLEGKFLEWNIHHNVDVIVSGNFANVVKAIRIGGWNTFPCYAHSLNLVVESSLSEISDTVNRARAIVTYFHRISSAEYKLTKKNDQVFIPQLKLKKDIPTRWNTTYNMLVSLLKEKEAVIATLTNISPNLNLPENDWFIIEKVIKLLNVFYRITEEIVDEKYVSASKYIVYCKLINQELNKYSDDCIESIQRLLIALKMQMFQRFGEAENNELLCEATILDPRFKENGFSDPKNFERASSELISKIDTIVTDESVQEAIGPQPIPLPFTKSIWDDFDATVAVCNAQNPVSPGAAEFRRYAQDFPIKRTEDPLLWWKGRKAVYPRLYKYMLKRLNISATSVPGEQMFTKAGQILNERRSSLKTKKMTEILFMSCN